MRRTIEVSMVISFLLSLIAGGAQDEVRSSQRVSLSAGNRTVAEARKSLCEADEKVVFSCTMQKSSKLLSLCTSRQVDAKTGYVQYRFGVPGTVELQFPAERKDSQAAFSYSRYTRPLVTYLTLDFESNGYKYSVHQDSNAEEKPPDNSSYLEVTAPGDNVKPVEMKCRLPVIGSLMLLEDVVPRKEDAGSAKP